MVINVYKPRGWTSNDVVQKIKHSCGFKKVGHAGTLDPLAEGVLLVLTDEDTKKQSEFMGLPKVYLVDVALGLTSDSDDLGTDVTTCNFDLAYKVSSRDFDAVLGKYVGKFSQQVPAYSAVKMRGRRLYSRARNKENFEKPSKEVEVFNIELVSSKNFQDISGFECPVFELKVTCGKGFYVRSLARDIGKDLNCGAVVTKLIRTRIGDYCSEESLSLNEVLLKHLKP